MRSALGIWAEVNAMNVSETAVAEAKYTSEGPWIMWVEVNGRIENVNQFTPHDCVVRADLIYPGWTETKLQTQEEFFT